MAVNNISVRPNVCTCTQNNPAKNKSTARTRILTTTLLVASGVALGYGHKNYISKALDFVKGKFAKLISMPQVSNIIEKGKGILDKIKDMVLVKPTVQ